MPSLYFKDFRMLKGRRFPEIAFQHFPVDKLNETEYLDLESSGIGDDFIRVSVIYTGICVSI